MTTERSRAPLRELFLLNRSVLDEAAYARVLEIERNWVLPAVRALELDSPPIESRAALLAAFEALLEGEKGPSPVVDFLAHEATREQFTAVVHEFAIDALVEAQSFFPILSRVPPKAQMALMRVFIDEMGCGNLEQSHSERYRKLLAELGLPTEIDPYLDRTNEESFAFINVYSWLAQRASHPEYFLGSLAYLEASVPFAFVCFADACKRLGIANDHYYTEHMHIDRFHARELLTAIRECEAAGPIDYNKVWAGIRLTSAILGRAVDAAVEKAQRGVAA